MQKKNKFIDALSIIIVMFPILFEYNGGIATMTLGDVVLITWLSIYIIKEAKLVLSSQLKFFLILLGYLSILFITQIIAGMGFGIIMKFARYLLYLIVGIVIAPKVINAEHISKNYKIFAIITTSFLILQIFSFYVLGRQLKGFIPFLPRGSNDYQSLQYLSNVVTTYRPCSLFSEPATYASYTAGCLVISLFDKNKQTYLALFLSLGLILSTSSTAIITLVSIWITWIIWVNWGKIKISRLFMIALVGTFSVLLFSKTRSILYVFDRIFISGRGLEGRFGNYEKLINVLRSDGLIRFLFGHTMFVDERIVYVPGWGSFLYSFGLIGLILLILAFISLLKHLNNVGKGLIICFMVLSIGTVVLISFFVMLYFALAIVLGDDFLCERQIINNWRNKKCIERLPETENF